MFDVVATYHQGIPRIHYDRFTDGVHLNKDYAQKCAKKLMMAMNHNNYVLGRALGHDLVYNWYN